MLKMPTKKYQTHIKRSKLAIKYAAEYKKLHPKASKSKTMKEGWKRVK